MGKLIEVGTGKLHIDEFEEFLALKKMPRTIIPAHPQGLHLSKVMYPYLDLNPKTEFSVTLQSNKIDFLQVV